MGQRKRIVTKVSNPHYEKLEKEKITKTGRKMEETDRAYRQIKLCCLHSQAPKTKSSTCQNNMHPNLQHAPKVAKVEKQRTE